MYAARDSPRYIPGGSANTAVCFIVAALALVVRLVHIHENKKLERAEAEGESTTPAEENNVGRRAFGFRYVY